MVIHGGQRDAEADIFSGCYERYASVTALVNAAGKLDASLTDGRHTFARIRGTTDPGNRGQLD